MRTFKRIFLLLFILILIFVAYTLISTGFFRTVEREFGGKVLAKIAIKGAEDIMVSRTDSFALISATNRLKIPSEEEETGGLFLLDLKTNDFTPIPLASGFDLPFAPHGISFFKKDSSYRVMAINHTNQGHSIEVFELIDQDLKHIKTMKDPAMVSPNDIVMLGEERFYFTNDHGYTKGFGKLVEEYGGFGFSNVVYFDGNDYKEVAGGIAYANGINYDKDRSLLYVASPRGFLVNVYTVNQDGTLAFVEDIACGTGVDNIELDQEANLWIGCHPNLLRFNAYAKGKKETAPSEIIKITYQQKGDYDIEQIYVDDGQEMSGATVATPFGNLIFAGNVMDDKFLILER